MPISAVCKEHLQINKKRQTTPLFKWTEDLNRHKSQVAKKHSLWLLIITQIKMQFSIKMKKTEVLARK